MKKKIVPGFANLFYLQCQFSFLVKNLPWRASDITNSDLDISSKFCMFCLYLAALNNTHLSRRIMNLRGYTQFFIERTVLPCYITRQTNNQTRELQKLAKSLQTNIEQFKLNATRIWSIFFVNKILQYTSFFQHKQD